MIADTTPIRSICLNPMWGKATLNVGEVGAAKQTLAHLFETKVQLTNEERESLKELRLKTKNKLYQTITVDDPLYKELLNLKKTSRKLLDSNKKTKPSLLANQSLSLSQKQLPKGPFENHYEKISEESRAFVEQHKTNLAALIKRTFLGKEAFFQISHNECEEAKKICAKEITFPTTFAAGKAKNRYTDTLPYRFNQMGGQLEDYVNASLINYRGKAFIAAQAPVLVYKHDEIRYDTIDDFLYLFETGANTIITLTMAEEKGVEKCPEWWSEENPLRKLKEGCTFEYSSTRRIHLNVKDNHMEQGLIKRTFIFTKKGEDKKRMEREITQYHFINWLDGNVPHLQVLEALIKRVSKHQVTGPLIVHCSAGVGRTGTFIMAYMLYLHVKEQLAKKIPFEQIELNFLKEMITLRTQRMKMVGTAHQYHAVMQLIANLGK